VPEQLVEAKAALRDVAEIRMPQLLDDASLGLSTIITPVGHVIKIMEVIRGSIPKANEVAAFKWLEDNGNGKLIKRTFAIEFGKGDEKWADKFERDCGQRKRPLNIKRKKMVHPQSLQAFIRQQLLEGVAIPMQTFGVFRHRISKVTTK